MRVTQFLISKNTPIYGIKQYNDNINKYMDLKQVTVSFNHGKYELASKLLPKYYIHRSDVNHFTDPNMVFMGEFNPPRSIISLMDTIEEDFYICSDMITNIRNKNYPKFDKIVTISEYSKQCINRVYNIPLDNISIVPCGVDQSRFYPNKYSDDIDDYNLTLLYVGNTMPHKHLTFIVEVCKKLQTLTDDHVVFTRAGYHDERNIHQINELQNIKNKARMYNVDFRDVGYINHINYNYADVYVAPSLVEGFDLPIIEAMSCNTPVVASNTSSHPEVCGNNATLCEFDIDEWCNAILKATEGNFYNTSRLRDHLNKFSWKNAANKLLEVYNEVYTA